MYRVCFALRTLASTFLLFAVLLNSAPAPAQAVPGWVGSWSAAQQLVETRNELPLVVLRDGTLRQVVHLSIGGSQLRVRLSNRFGLTPLRVASVHIARSADPATARIGANTDAALTFSGAPTILIPAGADYASDPIVFPVSAQADIAITLHMDDQPSHQTGHPGSRATSYVVPGDHVGDPDFSEPLKLDHWYFIAGIDVSSSSQASAIVALGDSITDGHGATTNGNDRWPDDLAKRLNANPATHDVAVLNLGIGGNRVLLDGLGPNALARFTTDVVAQPGAENVIVLEGVNDIGALTREHDAPQTDHNAIVVQIESAYRQMVTVAHDHGIKVIGATILPFAGSEYYHPGISTEADRQAINAWIRANGNFDAVIDFDELTRDPQNPSQLLAAYDSGDHLHPSAAGYAAMANAIPLALFSHAAKTQSK